MKVLVTGANGYIGYGVVKELMKDGIDVISTDISVQRRESSVEYIQADIFQIDHPYLFFGKPDILLHLAWRDGFKHSSHAHMDDLPKHYAFIERMIEEGVRQVCILGSVHEVGFYEGSVNEDTPTNPQSLYGIAKNALRNAAMLKANEYKTIFQWIRGFYIVGNTEMGCSVFSKIAEANKEGKKHFPFTNGLNQFDFIDYDLFCRQVVSTIEQTEVTGIINCCSGYPEKISDRVEKFIKDSGYDMVLDYGAFPEREYDSKAVWGDNKKILRIVGNKKHEDSMHSGIIPS